MLSVQERFNRASRTYDEASAVQKASAHKLCEQLIAQGIPKTPTSILDLGAGTGGMTEALWPYFSNSRFTLADFSAEMLSSAAQKFQSHSNIEYQCVDFSTHSFDFHELIVSNLALQWVKNWQEVISRHAQNTHTLAFSCLLSGTFSEWYALINQYHGAWLRPAYPTEEALIAYLDSLDATVVTTFEDYVLPFANTRALMSYLKALGASATEMNLPFSALREILAHASPIHLKYRIFYGVIHR